MNAPTSSTSPTLPPEHIAPPGPRVNPWLLWFVALGGVAMWSVHLCLAWSAMELSCLNSRPTSPVYLFVGLSTGIPFVVSAAAAVSGLVLRTRVLPSLHADELARDRVRLMLTVGIVLDLLAWAAIGADGIALLVLSPC